MTINRAAASAACVGVLACDCEYMMRCVPAWRSQLSCLPPLTRAAAAGAHCSSGRRGKQQIIRALQCALSQPIPSTPIGHREPGPRVTHNWAREQAAINPSSWAPHPRDKTKHSALAHGPAGPLPLPTPATARARRRPAGASPWALPGIRRGASSSSLLPFPPFRRASLRLRAADVSRPAAGLH